MKEQLANKSAKIEKLRGNSEFYAGKPVAQRQPKLKNSNKNKNVPIIKYDRSSQNSQNWKSGSILIMKICNVR